MSSDIYIPLEIVLSQPGHFELKTALNVSIRAAVDELKRDDVDWDYIKSCLEPVLLCKFGKRDTWRHASVAQTRTKDDDGVWVVTNTELHISCSGDFRYWLMHWLDENGFKYTII